MRAKFDEADFLDAARAIAVERGPAAATVVSITERLKAPTGSFYHRFASRDVLLGTLWLKTILDFQQGVAAAQEAGDGLAAALHTPNWSRQHLDEARLLLLFKREDFVAGKWPEELRGRVSEMSRRMDNAAPDIGSAGSRRAGASETRRGSAADRRPDDLHHLFGDRRRLPGPSRAGPASRRELVDVRLNR